METLVPDARLIYSFSVSRGEFRKIGEETAGMKRAFLGIGFPSSTARRALIAAYELGMNIVIHAFRGCVRAVWKDGTIIITAQDEGPGIPDIELALKEGFSTAPEYVREMGFGAGMGLPNVKKASDRFWIESTVGQGTQVTCVITPGPQEMSAVPYFHSVRMDLSRCKGCTNCIKSCPTEAIRVRNGRAFILEDRCIDCGECIRRCPNRAKKAVSDPWEVLSRFDYKIALIPPSFYGQFADADPEVVRAALVLPGGFDEVFDVSIGADLASRIMRRYIQEHPGGGPFISPACPAVLRLIQVRYPSLLKHVIPCEAPMEIAAYLAKHVVDRPREQALPAAVFISPCPAKITAARQPVGRGRSLVDAVIPSYEAYAWVRERLDQARQMVRSRDFPQSSVLGLGWGGSGGEMEAVGACSLAVDGIAHVSSVLDAVERGDLPGEVDFIEAQACVDGCAGGCLHVENSAIARMRVRALVKRLSNTSESPLTRGRSGDEPQYWFSLPLLPRPVYKLDDDPKKAEEKLGRLRHVEQSLPGLDCGACGAPTCRALAEDIVLERGSELDCTFKLREKLETLAEEVMALARKKPPAMAASCNDGCEKAVREC